MPISVNSNLTKANAAKAYANSFILQGTTQLINNQLDEEYTKAHSVILKDVRTQSNGFKTLTGRIDLLKDYALKVQLTYRLSSKYNTGNCFELALLALDYFLNNEKNTRAEVFEIWGGDHAFLVVGRNPSSRESCPSTWGDDAYICDPWAGAVYPAKDYLTNLKNYYTHYDKNRELNAIEAFDPTRHILKRMNGYDTDHLSSANILDTAKNITMQRFDEIKGILAHTSQKISSTIQTILLTNKNEETLLKHLLSKNVEIINMINKLQDQKTLVHKMSLEENFHINYEKLVQTVNNAIKDAVKIINFNYAIERPADSVSQQTKPADSVSQQTKLALAKSLDCFSLFSQKPKTPESDIENNIAKEARIKVIDKINSKMEKAVNMLKHVAH